MPHLLDDLRFAGRSLAKRPGFAAVVVATLAIGVGANSAIFSVVNGVLLEPIPVREPARLVVPDVISPLGYSISLSIPNFRDWRERNRVFESFGAVMTRNQTLTGLDRPQMIEARLVLGDFFETLGVPAAIGRTIPSGETEAGAAPVAVVSHVFWEQQLGGTAEVLGRTLTLDGEPFT
ncbi:MAG: ABC transporter permease, partial [Gemmatimonadota bacterium]|nr:ABC transporter permease [Gemmatimonadota bacterium]